MSGGAHWLYLVVAGLFEIGWPLGLKLASNPSMKVWGLLLAVGCMGLSGLFLWLALKGIPMGSAYAVWTGIGAVGTAVIGMLLFHTMLTRPLQGQLAQLQQQVDSSLD